MRAESEPLTKLMKEVLGDKTEKVMVSSRMADSPCVLTASEHGWSANMRWARTSMVISQTERLVWFVFVRLSWFINVVAATADRAADEAAAAEVEEEQAVRRELELSQTERLVWFVFVGLAWLINVVAATATATAAALRLVATVRPPDARRGRGAPGRVLGLE